MRFLIHSVMVASFAVTPVLAQSADAAAIDPAPELAIELNALDVSDGGCRMSFVATNRLGAALDSAGFEMALFGADGGIDRLLALDFGAMTAGKTRVLQFDIAGLSCADVGRVLVNDVTACGGDGLAEDACLTGLVATSRLDVEFGV